MGGREVFCVQGPSGGRGGRANASERKDKKEAKACKNRKKQDAVYRREMYRTEGADRSGSGDEGRT